MVVLLGASRPQIVGAFQICMPNDSMRSMHGYPIWQSTAIFVLQHIIAGMNRRHLLTMLGSSFALGATQPLSVLSELIGTPTPTMPVLYVGHGNPMNAITTNRFADEWERIGKELQPRAIVCVSAHWETRGSRVTAMQHPKTIHDFGGFPDELFRVQYPAPGSLELAQDIARLTHETILLDHEWGLDHGAWSVLKRMFPSANIPVIQVSLDVMKSPLQHVEVARQLSSLRRQGVVIVGSGNIVHNLGMVRWKGGSLDWALEFDAASMNQRSYIP